VFPHFSAKRRSVQLAIIGYVSIRLPSLLYVNSRTPFCKRPGGTCSKHSFLDQIASVCLPCYATRATSPSHQLYKHFLQDIFCCTSKQYIAQAIHTSTLHLQTLHTTPSVHHIAASKLGRLSRLLSTQRQTPHHTCPVMNRVSVRQHRIVVRPRRLRPPKYAVVLDA